MNWYVLFVQTGKEYQTKQLIIKQLDTNLFKPFIPLHQKIFKISGLVKKELDILFPGYVFIESELSSQDFIKGISTLVHDSSSIVRILKYSDSEIAVSEQEKRVLQSLCNDDYCIESSSGVIDGNKLHITEGPLKGWESILKKVDRHKRQAWIEVKLMGDKRLLRLALEAK